MGFVSALRRSQDLCLARVCKKAGEEMPGPMINSDGMDFEQQGFELHGLCLRLLIESARQKNHASTTDKLVDGDRREKVSVASIYVPKSARILQRPNKQPLDDVAMKTEGPKQASLDDIPDAVDLVRRNFPEVWLFDDYQLE